MAALQSPGAKYTEEWILGGSKTGVDQAGVGREHDTYRPGYRKNVSYQCLYISGYISSPANPPFFYILIMLRSANPPFFYILIMLRSGLPTGPFRSV